LSIAVGGVYARRRLDAVDNVWSTTTQMVIAFLVLLAFAPVAGWTLDVAALSFRAATAVIYSGVIGSAVAFLLFFSSIQRFGVTAAATYAYLQPLVATILGAALLGEAVVPTMVLGGALILVSVFAVTRVNG